MTKLPSQLLVEQTATELARSMRAGTVSAQEVVETHIQRIEEVNLRLNAVVYPLFAEAQAVAKEADAQRASGQPLGPLHGVPITMQLPDGRQFYINADFSQWVAAKNQTMAR